ncbi:MAG: ABC transporter permease subunit [Burkholderiales bacterium]|nr:ABC transporter permease subunit [Burkholderiales bacterium]
MSKFKANYFERNDSWPKIISTYLILSFFSLLTVFPILNLLTVAFKPGAGTFVADFAGFFQNFGIANFRDAFAMNLGTWIKNSLIISTMTAIIGVTVSITAAYAFSRFQFWGKRVGIMSFLLTQMFPAPMLLLPMNLILMKLNLMNSFYGLLIPYIATVVPFSVWMLKGYFDTIPKSLEESAYIDGCNLVQALFKIVLPLSLPALAITTLYSFMQAWSEYVIASVILRDPNMITLPVGLVSFVSSFGGMWGVYAASAVITSFPVMLLFMFLSKYLVGDLTSGGSKE